MGGRHDHADSRATDAWPPPRPRATVARSTRCSPDMSTASTPSAANEHGALDATQEALIAIAASVRSTAGRCSRPGATASRRTRPWTKSAAASGVDARRRVAEPSGSEPAPDDRIADVLDVGGAWAIPPEYRAAVALRDLADLDYAEIAVVLGVPAGTVRSRIARGRAALADKLGNRDGAIERRTHRTP